MQRASQIDEIWNSAQGRILLFDFQNVNANVTRNLRRPWSRVNKAKASLFPNVWLRATALCLGSDITLRFRLLEKRTAFLAIIVKNQSERGERWRGPVVVVLLSFSPPLYPGEGFLLSMHVLFQQRHASHSHSGTPPGSCPAQQQPAAVGNRTSARMNIW